MSTSTTTIRVAKRTRDRLAAQAHQRGVSLATLLAELASRTELDAIFQAERAATLVDAANASVRDENLDWDVVAGDGLD